MFDLPLRLVTGAAPHSVQFPPDTGAVLLSSTTQAKAGITWLANKSIERRASS
jgi:hypothetical protein